MATPFSLSGSLQLPPEPGQPSCSVPFSAAGSFSSKVDVELNLTGSGTKIVDLGTIGAPGAKALLIEVAPNPTNLPVYVRLNGGSQTGQWELTPGGFLVCSNPSPVAGVTTVMIVYTADVVVRLRVVG